MHPELIRLLRRREDIIADHAWRDRDPDDHLRALIEISESITNWAASHVGEIDGRLDHYLQNASYGKALSHLLSGGSAPHHP